MHVHGYTEYLYETIPARIQKHRCRQVVNQFQTSILKYKQNSVREIRIAVYHGLK